MRRWLKSLFRFYSRKRMYPLLLTRMYPLLLTICLVCFINVSLLKVNLAQDTTSERAAQIRRKTGDASENIAETRWKTEQTRGKTEQTSGKTEQTRRKTEQTIGKTEQSRGKTEQTRGKTEQTSGKTEQTRRKTEQTIGKTEQTSGKIEQTKGKTEQTKGKTEQTIGKTEQTRGKTEQTKGKTEQTRGKIEQTKGKTEQTSGKTDQTRGKTGQTRGKTGQTKRKVERMYCNRTIEYTASHTTRIHNVILHPDKLAGMRRGGESIEEVKGQMEQNEYFRFKNGFLTVSCNGSSTAKYFYEKAMRRIKRKPASYINNILGAIKVSSYGHKSEARQEISGVTVAVCRKDYANLYWTVLELYSAYFTARTSGSTSRTSSLLFLDAHPASNLDAMWQILFNRTLRLGQLNETVRFTELTLRPYIRLMPIVRKALPIPYFNDFRHEMTNRAGGFSSRAIDCRAVTITFVVRKNYVAHPRNVKGNISRKLQNTEEVLRALNASFPRDKVRAVSFEDLSVRDQVKLISETDILLGVHGAGLAHTVFQVPGAGLVELFPKEYNSKKKRNPHFQQLAEWSGKLYSSWYSNYTATRLSIPPSIVTSLVQDMRDTVCATSNLSKQ